MKILKLMKQFVPILYCFIIILSIILNYDPINKIIYFAEGGFLISFISILIYIYIKKNRKSFIDKKEKKIIFFLTAILTILYICCYVTHNYFLYLNEVISLNFLIFIIIKISGYFIIYYNIIYHIFKFLPKMKFICKEKENKYFTNNKKSFWIIFVLILLFHIPYLIDSYPGYISYDFAIQIRQALGFEPLVNHHPYISTYIIKICINIGYTLTKSYTFGVFLYTLFQTIIYALICSYFIFNMAKFNIKKIFRYIALITILLFPFSNFYTVWLTKDIIFAFGIFLLTLQLSILITNNKKESFKNYFIFFISLLMVIIFRKNGIYIIILLSIIYLIFINKNRKAMIMIFATSIILFVIIDKPLRNYLEIENGSINEMFSIPIQQMARIYKYDRDNLTQKEEEQILSYFNEKEIDNLYDPLLSDPVKAVMKTDLSSKEKVEFLKLSIKLLVKYPLTSIKSVLCTTYNFYYIENEQFRGLGNFKEQTKYSEEVLLPTELEIKSNEGFNIFRKVDNLITNKNVPILNTLTNTGFYVNLYIILIGYIIYNKNYIKLITFCPIILVFLTQLAGPVVDQRYTYSLILVAPLIISITLYKIEKKQKKEKKSYA